MKKLDRFLARRKELIQNYNAAFRDNKDIITPYQMEGTESGWHLYIIQVPHHDRKKVFEQLREKGIGVNVHYIPVYMHPYGYEKVHCKNAEEVYSHIISLPLYPGLTDEEQSRVIETVQETLRQV